MRGLEHGAQIPAMVRLIAKATLVKALIGRYVQHEPSSGRIAGCQFQIHLYLTLDKDLQ